MNNKYLKIVAFLFIVVLVFIVLIKKTPSQKQLTQAPPPMISTPNVLTDGSLSSPSISDVSENKTLKPAAATSADVSLKTDELTDNIKRSNALLEDFKKNSGLEIPTEFSKNIFQKINNTGDANTIGIMGYSPTDGTDLAILIHRGPVDPENIKKYIQDDVADELKMSITDADLKKAETIVPPPGSGFSSIQSWVIKENDKIAYISVAEKSDKTGTVLNVFSGPSSNIERNEEYYESLLLKFKSK